MDMTALSDVKFGDKDDLGVMLFENSLQHQLFRDTFFALNITVPAFPIADADVDNLDDWLQAHQVEHQTFAGLLGLNNPFNLLDVNWNKQDEFYDWLASHLYIHQQIVASLGL